MHTSQRDDLLHCSFLICGICSAHCWNHFRTFQLGVGDFYIMNEPRYKIGAALPSSRLEEHLEWIIADQRDLEIQDPVDLKILDGEWHAATHRIRTMLTGYTGRLGVHGPFDGLQLASFDPKVRAVATERLLQGLDFAAEIGASHMVVHSPWLTLGHHFVPTSPYYGIDTTIRRAHATLEAVVRRAEEVKCTLVIENIFDLHTEPWIALVRSFDSTFVRASVDIGHAYCMHRIGGASADAFVREAGPYLAHVHVQDTDGLSDRHWAPGDGEINFFALFEALESLEQTPRLLLELHDYSRVRHGANVLGGMGLVR